MRAWTVLVLTGLLLSAPAARAADVSQPFAASATVVRGCAVAATTLNFGTYAAGPTAPTVVATSSITVTCAIGDWYTIGLSDGSNDVGSQHRMARVLGPPSFLNYELYHDAGRTWPWRDSWLTRAFGIGTGAARVFTVYGRLPGAQAVPLGSYADTVTVVVRN